VEARRRLPKRLLAYFQFRPFSLGYAARNRLMSGDAGSFALRAQAAAGDIVVDAGTDGGTELPDGPRRRFSGS
jgi:hypothetical protein